MTQSPADQSSEKIKILGQKARELGAKHHGCAQVVMQVLMDYLDIQDDLLMGASSCMVGGTTQCLACGPLSAGFMIFGVKYGRLHIEDDPEILDRPLELASELTERFIQAWGTTNCCELTGFDMRNPKERDKFGEAEEVRNRCDDRIQKTTEWIVEIVDREDGVV